MKLFQSLNYPFNQERWAGKLALGWGIAAIPLLGYLFMKGWEYQISTRVYGGEQKLLPGWHGAIGMALRGLAISIAETIYKFPLYALSISGLYLWWRLMNQWWAGGDRSLTALADLYLAGISGTLLRIGLGLLLWVAIMLIYSAAYVRYIQTRDLKAFWQVWKAFRVAVETVADDFIVSIFLVALSILRGLIVVVLGTLLISTGFLTVLVPFLPALSTLMRHWVEGHLYGQLAQNTPAA